MAFQTSLHPYRWLTYPLLGGALLATGCTRITTKILPVIAPLPETAIAADDQGGLAIDRFEEHRIPVSLPPVTQETKGMGGLLVADINGDGVMDFIVTRLQFIAAYSLEEGELWRATPSIWLTQNSESQGLPGLHGPGVQVVDVDQDGAVEVLYLTDQNQLEILDGASGRLKKQVALPPVESFRNHWEQAIVANFSGEGDHDLLLQASRPTLNDEAYIRDSLHAAFSLSALLATGAETPPLWVNDAVVSLSHGSTKVMDINNDGKDEVVGATILGPDGQILYAADIQNTNFPHMDSMAVDDIDPDRPGLEVVMPEEAGEVRIILFDDQGTLWISRHRQRSPDKDGDKVAIGNFDPNRPGLEMWFRGDESAHGTVLDAKGELIASYPIRDRTPETWTDKGFEVIQRIRWTGDTQDYLVAKERHEAGDVGIFDALTGQVLAQFSSQTERLVVADVLGDWREEIIVLENSQIKIFQNTAPNPNPDQPRLWEDTLYRRLKMTGNYYSP